MQLNHLFMVISSYLNDLIERINFSNCYEIMHFNNSWPSFRHHFDYHQNYTVFFPIFNVFKFCFTKSKLGWHYFRLKGIKNIHFQIFNYAVFLETLSRHTQLSLLWRHRSWWYYIWIKWFQIRKKVRFSRDQRCKGHSNEIKFTFYLKVDSFE